VKTWQSGWMQTEPEIFDPKHLALTLWQENDFPDLRLYKRAPSVLEFFMGRQQNQPYVLHRTALRATSRFINNPRLKGPHLLRQAGLKTLSQLQSLPELIIPHDTSAIDEQGRGCPSDAGPLYSRKTYGYMIHSAAVCTSNGLLLGGIDAWAWNRPREPQEQTDLPRELADKESGKWDEGISRVRALLKEIDFQGIVWHVEDREADIYEHFVNCKRRKISHIVIRSTHDRKILVDGKSQLLSEVTQEIPVSLVYKKWVKSESKDPAKGLVRQEREAELELRFSSLLVSPPSNYKRKLGKNGLKLWIVDVRERNPPEGIQPVKWTLWTLYPVNQIEEAQKIVAIYAARWRAEDYFKITKTGCSLEKFQVDSLESFERLLAMIIPTASYLAKWAYAARQEPNLPAKECVEPPILQIVEEVGEYHRAKRPQGELTIKDFLLILAQIGNYELRKDREPGWLVIWRGWARVQDYHAIVCFARQRTPHPLFAPTMFDKDP
jgi:hypothetical protein